MKVAITGKGGVGKTTLSSTLARLYADEGRTVLAADVDPDANLGLALGLSQEEVDSIVPISKMRTLVEERTGATDANRFYKLNPYVADIPEKYAKDVNGVKLLVMGTVDVGGSGCVCPEHVMLKSILSALTYRKNDVVIMDMEAGLEHLGRGTAANMDQFIVVIEPGARSVQTYRNVKRLAADLGVKQVRVVPTKSATKRMRPSSGRPFRQRIFWGSSTTTRRSWTRTVRENLPTISAPRQSRKFGTLRRSWIVTKNRRKNRDTF